MHEEVFHRQPAKRGRKEKVLRTRKYFNTLKILDFMALKVKAVERLLRAVSRIRAVHRAASRVVINTGAADDDGLDKD